MHIFSTQKNIFLLSIVIFVVLLFVASVGNVFAAVNPEINYQGKLTTPTGVAVPNGTYNMRFWLLTSKTIATTSAVWTESLTSTHKVQVTNGLFSVMLGSTTPLTNVNFNQTLYLGVEIGGTGSVAWDGEMSPRKIIGTVPSAFVAIHAQNASTSDNATTFGTIATTSFLRSDQNDTASGLLKFTGGLVSSASSTITDLTTRNASTTNLYINGKLYDATHSAGANGYILKSTGTGQQWVATSSLGFGTSNFSTTQIDTCSELAAILSGQTTGTCGSIVLSASPTFTGTVLASAATLSGTTTINNAFLVSGTTGGTPASGAGTRMEFIPSKGAFRAGTVGSTEWDTSNIGSYSSAFGQNTRANGEGSLAFGDNTGVSSSLYAQGGGSFAGGYLSGSSANVLSATSDGSFAFGYSIGTGVIGCGNCGHIQAAGNGAVAMGYSSAGFVTASGAGSFALGYGVGGTLQATGQASFALGENVGATQNNAFALGKGFTNNVASSFGLGFGSQQFTLVGSNGKVGIGTTTPSRKLTVGGDAWFGGNLTATGTLAVSGATTLSSTLNVTGKVTLANATTTNFAITGKLYDGAASSGSTGYVLKSTATGFQWVATSTLGLGASGATVSSVALSAPTGFSVSGSPITTSGTLALSYAAGYAGVLTASTTNWQSFYTTPSSRITAGTGLSWSSNTLNCATASGSTAGCLSTANWTSFNGRISSTSLDTSAELAALLTDETGSGSVVFSANPTFTGKVTLANATTTNFAITGKLYDSGSSVGTKGYVLKSTGTSTRWVATSTLGLASTFLSLTDTPSSYNANRIPYETGSGLTDSTNFTYDGTNLGVGANNGFAIGGVRILYSSTTNNSIVVGDGAGSALTGASIYNVALGYQALHLATSSSIRNTAVGFQSLYFDNSGSENTALGYAALTLNTKGSYNTAVGRTAFGRNTTGNNNAALGYFASWNNTLASGTVSVGANAAIGTGVYSNQGGTYVGYNSGYSASTSSNYNTLLGYQSGYLVSSGANNIILGAATTTTGGITTGKNNILLGLGVRSGLSQTGSNQLNIGNLIFGTSVAGGNNLSSGMVGIGTSTPSQALTVAGSIRATGALYGSNNSAGSTGYVLKSTATGFQWVATSTLGLGASGATVSSVALSAPTGFSVSGSPVTTSGTLALSYAAGYAGVLTASTSAWQSFYTTPSSRITAGTGLSWSSNTLNCATASGSTAGCLSTANWTSFNGRISSTSLDTSAELAALLTDETGSAGGGLAVFSVSPTFTGTITAAAANFSGSVGIGTTTPWYKLSVVTSSAGIPDGINIQNRGANGWTDISLGNDTGRDIAEIGLESSGIGGNMYIWNKGARGINFGTSGTQQMKLDANGRLGIGTTTPNQKLSIYASGADRAIEFSGASGSTKKWTIGVDDSDGGKFKISSSSALGTNDRFVIDGRGYVGIGTSTPLSKLSVVANTGWGLAETASHGFAIYAGSNSRALYMGYDSTIDAGYISASRSGNYSSLILNPRGGSVGIGTSTPSYKLQLTATGGSNSLFAISSSSNSRLLSVDAIKYGARLEVVGDIVSKGMRWATSTPPAYSWRTITYGNGKFVALPSGDTPLTSPDGAIWTQYLSAIQDSSWQSITYGNGLFVGVSDGGSINTVVTSPDGVNWTMRTQAKNNVWRGVTYGNGTFVAVAASTTNSSADVMTSPDGITWTSRAGAQANSWGGVAYGNNIFVAVAEDGTNRVMTSPDGITWTPRSAASASGWNDITYGNGLFVAVGWGGEIMTSPDGITWTSRTGVSGISNLVGITYGSGLFVAISSFSATNHVITSPDGITWTQRRATEDNSWVTVTYGNGRFVALSYDGTNRAMTSGQTEQFQLATNNIYQGGMSVFGNVGIGTSTPNQKLSIYASGADRAIEFSGASGSTKKWTIGVDDSDGGKFKISSSSALGTNDRFVIDGAGNVGIGTSNPTRSLQINNAGVGSNDHSYLSFTTGDTGSTVTDGLVVGYDASNQAYIWNYESTSLTFGTGNTNRMFISSIGNIGIGTTTSPSARVAIKSAAATDSTEAFQINNSANTLLAKVWDGGKAFFKGSVGIGTTTPQRILDVLETNSVAQLRLSKTLAYYAEMLVNNVGDLFISTVGGNVRLANENLHVCEGGACPTSTATSTEGNLFVENAVTIGSGFSLRQISTSEIGLYATTGALMVTFDNGL